MQNDAHRTGCGCATCGPQRPSADFNELDREDRLEAALRWLRDELHQHDKNVDGSPRRWVWDCRKRIDVALGAA